jgi:predicted glycosyltransferase
VLAARTLRIPVVTTMDFEYQPINHLAFRLAHRILLPEALPADVVERQGARGAKVIRHAGIKESIYLGDFVPDRSVLDELEVDREAGPLVVARTPPSRAVYHRMENPLFGEALERIGTQPEVTCVVLPRHREQVAELEALGLPNVRVPRAAVDSRSLLYEADLFLGAGGTMTREAALMGTPTLSLFAGRTPAVDEWLVGQGLIERFESADQVAAVERRAREPRTPAELREDSAAIIDEFVATVNDALTAHGRSRS